MLRGSGHVRCVPYMAGHLTEDFVPRPDEYARLKAAVLTAPSGKTVAVTTALLGAGGLRQDHARELSLP